MAFEFDDGLPFSSLTAMSDSAALTSLNRFFNNAQVTGKGRNQYRPYLLMEDLGPLIERSEDVWLGLTRQNLGVMNTRILPLELTDNLDAETTSHRFEFSMPTLTPALASGRTIRQKTTTTRTHLHNFSVDFDIEGEVYDSKYGAMQLTANLLAVNQQQIQFLEFRVYSDILRGGPLKPDTYRSEEHWRDRIIKEVDEAFSVHKYPLGIKRLDQKYILKMESSDAEVPPTAVIVPHGKMGILTYGSPEYTHYDKGGQEAVDAQNGNGKVATLNTLEVVEAPKVLQEQGKPPLTMNRAIYLADYAVLELYPGIDGTQLNGPEIEMYDGYMDKCKVVEFVVVLAECGLFIQDPANGNWRLKTTDELKLLFDGREDKMWAAFADGDHPFYYHKDDKNAKTHGGVRDWDIGGVKVYEPHTPKEWASLCKGLVIRPMRGQMVQDIAYVAGGPQLGKTMVSKRGMMVSQDIRARKWTWRLDYRFAPHIINWNRVAIATNAIYDGVLPGNNAKIMSQDEAKVLRENGFHLDAESIPAMYALMLPAKTIVLKNEWDKMPRGKETVSVHEFKNEDAFMSIRGFWPQFKSSQKKAMHYPGARFYDALYGWDILTRLMHDGVDTKPICMTTFQAFVRYRTANGYQELPGTGHHGAWEGTGCRIVRRLGESPNPNVLHPKLNF